MVLKTPLVRGFTYHKDLTMFDNIHTQVGMGSWYTGRSPNGTRYKYQVFWSKKLSTIYFWSAVASDWIHFGDFVVHVVAEED